MCVECALYPIYTVPDSCGHDIEFGQFTVIVTLTTFSMIRNYTRLETVELMSSRYGSGTV